jgi:hypothetical protein
MNVAMVANEPAGIFTITPIHAGWTTANAHAPIPGVAQSSSISRYSSPILVTSPRARAREDQAAAGREARRLALADLFRKSSKFS